jgi:hypothetical protein
MIAIAKWVGIILCIICGIGLMAGSPGTVAKVSGLILGLGPERTSPVQMRGRNSGDFRREKKERKRPDFIESKG